MSEHLDALEQIGDMRRATVPAKHPRARNAHSKAAFRANQEGAKVKGRLASMLSATSHEPKPVTLPKLKFLAD